MPRKPKLETLTDVVQFISACLCGGCSMNEAEAALVREGFVMDVPLAKKDQVVTNLCKQIVAIAERNPPAGQYYASLVAASRQAIEVDKRIEDA